MIAAIITCQSADVYGGVWMLIYHSLSNLAQREYGAVHSFGWQARFSQTLYTFLLGAASQFGSPYLARCVKALAHIPPMCVKAFTYTTHLPIVFIGKFICIYDTTHLPMYFC
jgi:hypothetical protein